MPTDVDRLSDLANTASYLADRSHRLEDHADAARAHFTAWKATKANGREDRPSLGESHLRRATEHDKVASEPDSYAQKCVLARAASKKADTSPSVGTFRAAAKAHKEAGAAWRKENPAKVANGGGDPWEPRDHDRQSKNYDDQADFLEKKDGSAAEDPASKLEAKMGAVSTPAAPSAKRDARQFSSASSDATVKG